MWWLTVSRLFLLPQELVGNPIFRPQSRYLIVISYAIWIFVSEVYMHRRHIHQMPYTTIACFVCSFSTFKLLLAIGTSRQNRSMNRRTMWAQAAESFTVNSWCVHLKRAIYAFIECCVYACVCVLLLQFCDATQNLKQINSMCAWGAWVYGKLINHFLGSVGTCNTRNITFRWVQPFHIEQQNAHILLHMSNDEISTFRIYYNLIVFFSIVDLRLICNGSKCKCAEFRWTPALQPAMQLPMRFFSLIRFNLKQKPNQRQQLNCIFN